MDIDATPSGLVREQARLQGVLDHHKQRSVEFYDLYCTHGDPNDLARAIAETDAAKRARANINRRTS